MIPRCSAVILTREGCIVLRQRRRTRDILPDTSPPTGEPWVMRQRSRIHCHEEDWSEPTTAATAFDTLHHARCTCRRHGNARIIPWRQHHERKHYCSAFQEVFCFTTRVGESASVSEIIFKRRYTLPRNQHRPYHSDEFIGTPRARVYGVLTGMRCSPARGGQQSTTREARHEFSFFFHFPIGWEVLRRHDLAK